MNLRIGTRGSQLALWQAHELSRLLREAGATAEIVTVKTTGDRRQDVSLASIGGKGLFIKELEEALDERSVDLAVHSLKDVPSLIPDRFELAGFLERADPRDAWVRRDGTPIERLPRGAVVGTSSPRRRSQILSRWTHVRVEDIRGNVETRLARERDGSFDGVILASAGLTRLGRIDEASSFFGVGDLVPAAGQGIVAVEIHRDRGEVREILRRITHAPSETAALIERGVLQRFGTRLDCYSPIAVHAAREDGAWSARAFLGDLDGVSSIRVEEADRDPEGLVDTVATRLMNQGAAELLAATRG